MKRSTLLGLFSAFLFLLFLTFKGMSSNVDTYKSDTPPEIKKVCMGMGKYAAVLEKDEKFYVISSRQVLQEDFMIVKVEGGLEFGGRAELYYMDGPNKRSISVDVVSRMEYKYSGYPGARSVCRDLVSPR